MKLAIGGLAACLLLACGGTGVDVTDSGLADTSTADTGNPSDASSASDTSTSNDASDASNDASTKDSSAPGDYGADGPNAVTQVAMTVKNTASFTVQVFIPSSSGPHPVVVLSSGLIQPASAYKTYGNRLASWGIVAVLRDDPGIGAQTSTIVSDVVYVVSTWLAAQNTTQGSKLYGLVDASKVGLAGHSRGGEVSLLAAEGGAKGLVHGVFGLDPVDGMSGTVAITSIGTITTPLAFIGETTDSAANGCAPAANNFQALYAAASSPAVAITAINADHTMFEDPAGCAFCTLCTAGTATQSVVESESARYLTAFFARELLGDTNVGAAFQGAGITSDVNAGIVSVVSK